MNDEGNLANAGKHTANYIREMIAALECDYGRLRELRQAQQSPSDRTRPWSVEDSQELADLEAAAGDCKDKDDALQLILNDPLEITFRTRWMERREVVEYDDWDEACIIVATGGPAVRIIVELEDGEPYRAYMQTQDWGTPWTDYQEQGIGKLLMAYVSVFCWERT